MADDAEQEKDREQLNGDSDFEGNPRKSSGEPGESPDAAERASGIPQPDREPPAVSPDATSAGVKKQEKKVEAVKDMPFDEVVNVEESESVQSDQEDEPAAQPSGVQVQAQPRIASKGAEVKAEEPAELKEENSNDEVAAGEKARPAPASASVPAPANAYNPMDYADLKVSSEISELFQYIGRYHPHNVELDTKFKPFVPEYIPAVGEVDAFLKVPRPDNVEECLGLTLLDEPTINPVDPSVLEMQYIQTKKQKQVGQVQVRSLEQAEQNPKQVQQWIDSVDELHKTRPPPTVQYTKTMPDIESLMQEWAPEMEDIFGQLPLPGPDLDLPLHDYAKLVCAMLDVPVHKLANKKGIIEALHHLFSLYAEFKDNPHFGRQKMAGEAVAADGPKEEVNYMKISQ